MTVKELIDTLKEYPQDLAVYSYLGEVQEPRISKINKEDDKDILYLDCGC